MLMLEQKLHAALDGLIDLLGYWKASVDLAAGVLLLGRILFRRRLHWRAEWAARDPGTIKAVKSWSWRRRRLS